MGGLIAGSSELLVAFCLESINNMRSLLTGVAYVTVTCIHYNSQYVWVMQAVSRAPEDGSGRHEVDEDAVWRFSQQPQRGVEDEAGVLVGDSRYGWRW